MKKTLILMSLLCLLLLGSGCQKQAGQSTKPEVPNQSEVIEAYKKANQLYSWFSIQTLPVDYNSKKVLKDTTVYQVNEPSLKTLEQLKIQLNEVFDASIVTALLAKNMYVEIEGKLYGIDAARGSDLTKGEEHYALIQKDSTHLILKVTVALLSTDGSGKQTGTQDFEFNYDQVNGHWCFTTFPEIR